LLLCRNDRVPDILLDNAIGDAGMQAVGKALATNRALKELNIYGIDIPDTLVWIGLLTGCCGADSGFGPAGTQALATGLASNTTLVQLSMAGTQSPAWISLR
jgi:hypothetical protein